MKVKKVVAVILIIASLVFGYFGITKINESSASIELLEIEVDFSNKDAKTQGYIFVGLAVIFLGGGIYMLREPKNIIT
ncbi:MAG TPA: hypothetical protein VJ970_05980 [Flavobacteriaceae bacterium]|nr:hypothetical protein [Flavobacteriaceae bacterium]